MHTKLIGGALAVTGLGLTVTALAVAPAEAASVTQIRSTDLIQPAGTTSGTTGTAKADFLAEGIHIKTTNTSDAARGYWKVGVPLSQVHAVDYEWFGTRATTRRATPASRASTTTSTSTATARPTASSSASSPTAARTSGSTGTPRTSPV